MIIFLKDMDSLEHYSQNIELYKHQLSCKNCLHRHQFISHGYTHSSWKQKKPVKVGKRLFCSNRHGRTGCGATLQLYLKERIPRLKYSTREMTAFLLALLQGLSVMESYQKATGCLDPRNASRWIRRCRHQLSAYRVTLSLPPPRDESARRARHLQILLSTLADLFGKFRSGEQFQYLKQQSFV